MPAAIILTEEEELKICELYESGVSFIRLRKEHGYTQGVARKVLIKRGVTIRGRFEVRVDAREKKEEHKFIPRTKEKITVEDDTDKTPIDCNTQGAKCMFKSKISGGDLICDYLCMVGHSRGCSPNECTKYSFGKRKRGVNSGKTKK